MKPYLLAKIRRELKSALAEIEQAIRDSSADCLDLERWAKAIRRGIRALEAKGETR